MNHHHHQEIFTLVCNHAFAQNHRAVGPDGHCMFRTPDNSRCFQGALIPDDQYRPEFEGAGLANLIAVRFSGSNATESDLPFLRELMQIHDKYAVQHWPVLLHHFAVRHRLTIPPILEEFMVEEEGDCISFTLQETAAGQPSCTV